MQYELKVDELTLAIAIPSSRRDFDRQLKHPDRYDYVASVARRNPGISTEGLWNFLAPTVEICNYVASRSASVGVSVLNGFESGRLKEALTGRRAVTLVSHWRNSPITPQDLLDPQRTLSEILTGQDRVCGALLEVLGDAPPTGPALDHVAAMVAGAMNTCIQIEASKADHARHDAAPFPLKDLGLTRFDIEERFPDGLVASPDIELADGLIRTSAFIAGIPEDFDGVLDLTVCNSLILGSGVKRKRPEITAVMNRGEASGRLRVLLYLATVMEIKRKPQRYCDAAVNVRNALRRTSR